MAIKAVGLTTHIMNNQIKTVLLLMGFPLLMFLMMGSLFGAMDVAFQSSLFSNGGFSVHNINWGHVWQTGLDGIFRYGHIVAAVVAVWFLIAFFFHGRMMRAISGALPVTRKQMPHIYNMLENLCISRGISMPRFEIIDSPALNAFASGISDKTYTIVLTRGLIDRLSDDELEGVIAHELTHIINRDVRLLVISVIFVGIIGFFAEIIFRSLIYGRRPNSYSRRRRSNSESGGALGTMLIALVIFAIGYFFAILIRFAISRKREYLADAGSVELTKNPDAMMRALLRISGNDKVRGMPDDIQQMCIENSHSFMGIFATHPSIQNRVQTISRMTDMPVPKLQVSLRHGPRGPWQRGKIPEA
ncbi:MAG: M48 family metallopeptidase [Alphaproteobacteria bacterium]|nr:M48 family metallopeptidase [Alphaproteobacteria bacterium]